MNGIHVTSSGDLNEKHSYTLWWMAVNEIPIGQHKDTDIPGPVTWKPLDSSLIPKEDSQRTEPEARGRSGREMYLGSTSENTLKMTLWNALLRKGVSSPLLEVFKQRMTDHYLNGHSGVSFPV